MSDADARRGDASGEKTESNFVDDVQAMINQPGLAELREAVENELKPRLPDRSDIRRDGLAGLNSAISSVPDGLASGVLAGVNPIFGLYACMAGPIAGGIFSSTQLMVVATTSATALGAGQALAGIPFESRADALFLMVVLIGVFQIVFGLLGFGRLIRFVSFSVMTGFIIGIATLTILSQLSTITGYETVGNNRLGELINLLSNLDEVNPWTFGLAVLAMVLAVILPRTKLGNVGRLIAIVIPSVVVAILSGNGVDDVQLVHDVGEISGGLPLPALPDLSSMSSNVVTGALAVAVIALVQGAGVSQSVPNPDGSRRRLSRDFSAQGAANVASGLFQGLPVGGSLSTTALTVLSGARSRWAPIFAGLWMAAVVIIFPGLVSSVAMPALGALLIIASATTIKPTDVSAIWNAGWAAVVIAATTFLSTLLVPIEIAVGIGVALSAIVQIFSSSTDISIVALVRRPDGRVEERRPPEELPAHEVTVLDVYGSLFYAGAQTLERMLPRPGNAERAVVVLRLRGRTNYGATLVDVLANYADKLDEVGGRLYLSGLSENAYEQLIDSGKLSLSGPVRAYEATRLVGESTMDAVQDAQDWLVRQTEQES